MEFLCIYVHMFIAQDIMKSTTRKNKNKIHKDSMSSLAFTLLCFFVS